MNKKYFNSKFKEIKEILSDINLIKLDISNIQIELDTKNNMLNKIFNEKMKFALNKESKIKSLMDNRGFRYIKIFDFLSSKDIEANQGFSINTDSGFLLSETINKPSIQLFKKSINPSNKKEFIYEFDNTNYSNMIEFSFKDSLGLPLTPKVMKIEYNNRIEEFFEPNFRHYNRNSQNVFLNRFYFYPKRILRIYVEFEENADFEKSSCELFSCTFNTDSNNFIELPIINPNGISSFNLYKNTDETNIPLIFDFTEDNSTYEKIEFNNQEGIISLNKSGDFKIRIKKDYHNVETKVSTENKKSSIPYSEMQKINNIASFESNGRIKNFDIVFSKAAYKKMKESLNKIFNDPNKINDFIVETPEKIYKIKKEFLSMINEVNDQTLSLVYCDDIEAIKETSFYFSFLLDEKTKSLYCSSFMNEFNFFLELDTEVIIDKISTDLLTPYIFDLQIKG